jgi:mono/diheme cytochrome c family protein
MKFPGTILTILFLAAFLTGCGGQKEDDPAPRTQDPAAMAVALDQGPRAAENLTLEAGLAERGAVLFEEKICSDCHTLGEADLAPDLTGVLERRTRPWLIKQITDPEWMNEHDPITQALIEEFDLEMVTVEVSAAEAEAILHYLAREGGGPAD